MKEPKTYTKIICHDCKRELKEGEECVPYDVQGFEDPFIKCKACYEKDSVLRNFRKAEVYSRVVGYIRPVQQWNPGKKEEFKDRKTFKTN